MFARHRLLDRNNQRRGVVLVLILGMLALLALIGVTFASISGQAQDSSRKYSQSLLIPDARKMFDYGINQLINDTQNPLSAMYGHSLLRDMYGSDGYDNGGPLTTTVSIATVNTVNRVMAISTSIPAYTDGVGVARLAAEGEYGKSPVGWMLKLSANGFVPLSLEVVAADVSGNNLVVYTHLADPDPNFTFLTDPAYALLNVLAQNIQPPYPNVTAVLDGSYMRAFNGAGQTSAAVALATANNNTTLSELFRLPNHFLSGLAGQPIVPFNLIPMDEDYDACDLENMFLAMESADSSVVIPSFHRPSIVRVDPLNKRPAATGFGGMAYDDHTDFPLPQYAANFSGLTAAQQQEIRMTWGRFLRPRGVDHPTAGFKDLKPDTATGKIDYDIDNDGDGVTDSVWIDLGFPAQRDANGKIYKPLFAFKVIGLNGKLPLNTAGNLQARSLRDLNDFNHDGISEGDNLPDNEPLWDHASHLGYSVNEINPKYALQNHPTNVNNSQVDGTGLAYGGTTHGVPVNLTQLRNLLMGTRPMPAPDQPLTAGTPNWDQANGTVFNMDANTVLTGGRNIQMPNNVPDAQDGVSNSWISRNVPAVPGLWGEEQGVPQKMPGDQYTLQRTAQDLDASIPAVAATGYGILPNRTYYSRVGPGRSPTLIDYTTVPFDPTLPTGPTIPYPIYATDYDGTNDSYSAFDFYPATVPSPIGVLTGLELGNLADVYPNLYNTVSLSYTLEFPKLPSERFRSFVKPVDVSGNGLMTRFYTVPVFNYGAVPGPQFGGLSNAGTARGYGPDRWGRVSYFNYYRPPGVPYYTDTRAKKGAGVFIPLPIVPDSNGDSNYYNDPIANTLHNTLNGYESARMPRDASQITAAAGKTDFADAFLGVMPYNISDKAPTNPSANPNYSSVPARANYPVDSGWTAGGPTSTAPSQMIDTSGVKYLGTFDNVVNSWDNTRAHVYTGYFGGTAYYHPTIYGTMPAYNHASFPQLMGPEPYPGGSLGKDLAHEVNLYHPDSSDRPYTSYDLEWLYRQQDVDGANLDSRLKYLAPISFVYSPDAPMRRKMFSVETWELNNFTWAYDNPSGAFPNNTSFGPLVASVGNASIAALNNNPLTYLQGSAGLSTQYYSNSVVLNNTVIGTKLSTPGYGHRNRKINLNAPFPITNDPDDPIRKKWIYDTYQALKQVLPPKSIDTPEELLALSQYVVNIVDSRDSDAAMTHFVNPDVRQTPPDLGNRTSNPPIAPKPPELVMSTKWNGTSYIADPTFATALPVNQYGMENQPIAINEALAYRFYRRHSTTGANVATPRFWLELVNTLTQGQSTAASSIDLSGWQIAITPDDACGRPNPFTGQINVTQPKRRGNIKDTPAKDVSWPKTYTFPSTGSTSYIPLPVPPLRIDSDGTGDNQSGYYYIVGMEPPHDGATLVDPSVYPYEAGMPIPQTGPALPTYFGADPGEEHPALGEAVTTPKFPATAAAAIAPAPNATGGTAQVRATIPSSSPTVTGNLFEADEDSDGIPDVSPGAYYWVYLRRPANPLDPGSPKVVVDSIRIPYIENTTNGAAGTGSAVDVPGGRPATVGAGSKASAVEASAFEQAMYSLARLQPYRGGQLIPNLEVLDATGTNLVNLASQADYRYGFSEQHIASYRKTAPVTGETASFGLGLYSNTPILTAPYTDPTAPLSQVPTTDRIYHSLGRPNTVPGTNDTDDTRLPTILDRDFMNVVELTTVPACPPGLFTKQFINTPSNPLSIAALPAADSDGIKFPYSDRTTPVAGGVAPARITAGPPWQVPNGTLITANLLGSTTIPVYPYLADQFFYTAEGTYVVGDNPGGTSVVGGATGNGWHKMFELFEVPSSAMGAIGPVSQGANFDWYREDRRPGQINLNLVIDEEVFFGLIDDETVAKLNQTVMSIENNVPVYPPYNQSTAIPPTNFPALAVPRVVTQVDANGFPTYTVDANGTRWTGSYAMKNRGFDNGVMNTDPQDDPNQVPTQRTGLMKAAFADFLKLRHGGSGFLFSYGIGWPGGQAPVGSGKVGPLPDPTAAAPNNLTSPPAMDRPFHSLSFPDINFTVMRPASLPPSAITDNWNDTVNTPPLYTHGTWINPAPTDANGTVTFYPANNGAIAFVGDPGLKTAANLDTSVTPSVPLIEPFPGRPANPKIDLAANVNDFATRRNWMPAPVPPRRLFQLTDASPTIASSVSTFDSNASLEAGVRFFDSSGTPRSSPRTQVPIIHPTLFQQEADLVPKTIGGVPNPLKLGGYRAGSVEDRRQNPNYRNEWLQKVVSLSTVRTHQYAVWLTVGFFEVAKPGDPMRQIPDQLGPEIGASSGQNVRFRGFFVIDRTLANGYDPTNPADFRRLVTHWRRIE